MIPQILWDRKRHDDVRDRPVRHLRGAMVPQLFRLSSLGIVALIALVAHAQPDARIQASLDSAASFVRSGASDRARDLLNPLIAELSRQRDTLHLVRALNHLARAAYDMGDPSGALRNSERAVELGRRARVYDAVGSSLMLQAIVADQMSPPDTVKHLYEEALRYYLLAHDTAACAVVYDNLGFYPLLHHDIPGAIALSEKGQECLRDTTHENYHRSASIIESSLCNYCTWSGNHEAGIEHGLRSVRHAEQSGDLPQLVHGLTQLGAAYAMQQDFSKALPLLLRSDSIARAHSMPLNKRRDIPDVLSWVYEGLGDPVNALRYYKERSALHDSLRNDATRKEIERSERRNLHTADSLERVAALRTQEQNHQQRLVEEQARRNLLLAGLGCVVVIALIAWSRWRLVRKKNAEILTAQERLVESEKAREAEQVRTRIARDVHDDISSDLTRIGMLGTAVQEEMTNDPERAARHLVRLKELSRKVGSSLQDIVWAVDPSHDTAASLVKRASLHTERMLASAPLNGTFDFTHHGLDVELDPATRRDIYLLLKEALNNALKYADARNLKVRLRTDADGFLLHVSDDGRGFDPGSVRESGNGLGNMEQRALRLGASWSLISAPGHGTTMTVRGHWGHPAAMRAS